MQRKHLGVVLALALGLIGGPTTMATAQPIAPMSSLSVNAAQAKVVKQTTANLNLRKSATVHSAALVLIPSNTKLDILRVSGNWNQVSYKSKTGWVSGDYLKSVPAAKVMVFNYTKVFTEVKAKAASSSSSVVSVHRQTKVEVLGKSGSWTKVLVSGKTGFVPVSALSSSNPSSVYRWVKGKPPVFQSKRTTSKKIATLSNNSRIQWLRTSGSWQQVRTSGGIGWIQSSKLSTKAIKAPAKAKVYYFTKAFTSVKAEASSASANIVSVPRQTKVEVLGKSRSWTRVLVSGKTGFVPNDTLSSTNPVPIYRWVNGRQRAYARTSATSKTIVTMPLNTKVEWLRTLGSWQQVRTSAGIGWMQSSKLSTKIVQVAPLKPPMTFSAPRWTTANLNLRSGPGTSNGSIGVVPMGERVLLGRSSGGWANVKTSKGTGWVSDDYLSTVAPKPVVVKPIPPKPDAGTFSAPRWTTANLNLRSGPGTNHGTVGVVPQAERILLGRSSGGWANVRTSKGTGWVSVVYLSAVAPPPPVTAQYRWATGNVNLRAGNSTVYPIMGVVPAGERVTYLQAKNGWARVVSSLGTGWMSEDYLSKTVVATLQPDTLAVNAAVRARYAGYVSSYGGVRPGSVGHSSGRATDLMIKDYKSVQGIRNGDEIARFLIANRESLGISYLIWKDKIWLGPAKGWEEYSNSGRYGQQFVNMWNDTTLHLDHIHAETYGDSGTGTPMVD